MKKPDRKVRKNIMVNPSLIKHARNVLNAASDSQAIEMLLKSVSDRKTNEEVWNETRRLIKQLHNPNFKPLFS